VIRLRLRTRLTIWFTVSILLILTPSLVGILMLEWRSMRAALDHHLAEDLEVAVEMLVLREDAPVWRTDTDRDLGYDAGRQRWVEVYTRAGDPVYRRGFASDPAINAQLDPPGPSRGFVTERTPAGASVRTLTAERRVGTGTFLVRVARSEDGLRRDLRRLVLLFATIAPLAVLAAALAGFAIAGRALSPLARMAEKARSIGADRLTERLAVENPTDELGQLAVVFNEMFARLDAAFRRLKRFTGDVSHELRTPLTAIRSVGEVGLREARDAAAYREIIGSMLEEADRLRRVIDTLLLLSRWESGRVRPAISDFDLHELAREVAGNLSVLCEERNIRLDLALPGSLPVAADPVMVRQALTNVLDNAIKFSPDGGQVRIWSRKGDGHEIVVDDQGPGIAAQERDLVFERFYRGRAGREGSADGVGLGLAIAHHALAANHGRLVIDSNEDGGARIGLVFPRP
jgi:heavy metal sensor kinase